MENSVKTKAWWQGYYANLRGIQIHKNPYYEPFDGTQPREYEDWRSGWLEAESNSCFPWWKKSYFWKM